MSQADSSTSMERVLIEDLVPHDPADADPAVVAYFARLRALQTAVQEGWCRYVAGNNHADKYTLEVLGAPETAAVPGGQRDLLRGEAFWYVLGLGDCFGQGDLVLTPLEVPALYTMTQAAEVIDRTYNGVDHLMDKGQLYIAYPGGTRKLVAAQVDAFAAEGTPAAAGLDVTWRELRAQWPVATRYADLASYEPLPTDVNAELPVPTDLPEQHRRALALTLASEAAMLRYLWLDAPEDRFAVAHRIAGERIERVLPGVGVLPYTLGVADGTRHADVVAYRPGLV